MKLPLQLFERKILLILIDLLLLILAVLIALWVWTVRAGTAFDRAYLAEQAQWFLLIVPWLLFAVASGAYDLTVATDLARSARAILSTSLLVYLLYLLVYFFSPPNSLPRGVVLYHGIATLVSLILWRAAYIVLLRQPPFKRRAFILGAGWAGKTIAQAVREHLSQHYELIGFVDDDPAKSGKGIGQQGSGRAPLHVLGTSRDLVGLAEAHGVSEVILAITYNLSDDTFRALLDCQERGIQVTPMPVLYEQITGQVPVEHIGDNWYIALPLDHAGVSSFYPLIKRLLDIVGASIGLILFGLVLPFIALAIRLDSPGPIFYRQERVGKGGKVFKVLKLRTMVADAEKEGKAVWAQERDPRVTRVGWLLRATHVDEFPQFLNIIKGEMSAVGPRPERPELVAEMEKEIPFYRTRHCVKPGMAGWGLVKQGYGASTKDALIKLQYDLYYIKHQSVWLDLAILLKTFVDTFTLRGR